MNAFSGLKVLNAATDTLVLTAIFATSPEWPSTEAPSVNVSNSWTVLTISGATLTTTNLHVLMPAGAQPAVDAQLVQNRAATMAVDGEKLYIAGTLQMNVVDCYRNFTFSGPTSSFGSDMVVARYSAADLSMLPD
jgi:hypothetical protein